jgi:cytochrome P450
MSTADPDPSTASTDGSRHATYAALSADGPVRRITLPDGTPAWLVTGYNEVRQVLTDPRVIRTGPGGTPFADDLPAGINTALNTTMLGLDPPAHTRLRRLVGGVFTHRRIHAMEPRIQQITDRLLDGVTGRDHVELIEALAYPLPLTVICDLLGVPENARPQFQFWSRVLIRGTLAGRDAYVEAAIAMTGVLRGLVAYKRRHPADDFVNARDHGDRLDEDELTSMAHLLLVAGHETTVNLIANGTCALLRHPGQLALLRAAPDRLPAAVEEVLRHDGPLQVSPPLVTAAPIEVGGVTVAAGEVVVPGLLAANRDRSRWPDPERLNFDSAPLGHVAFGHGVHHCLGAPLARLEGRIALGTLLNRFPLLRLAVPPEELVRSPGLLMNGLTALPIALQPAR